MLECDPEAVFAGVAYSKRNIRGRVGGISEQFLCLLETEFSEIGLERNAKRTRKKGRKVGAVHAQILRKLSKGDRFRVIRLNALQ